MCGIALVILSGQAAEEREGIGHDDAKVLIEKNGALARRGPDWQSAEVVVDTFMLCASVLSLRGTHLERQPTVDTLTGNVLAFNGEIYRGEGFSDQETGSDTAFLLEAFRRCETEQDLVNTLEHLEGPFALVIWMPRLSAAFIARDRLGRRSLLVNHSDCSICSVASRGHTQADLWQELAPHGVYKLNHDCRNMTNLQLLPWSSKPPPSLLTHSSTEQYAQILLDVLSEAVKIRVKCNNGSKLAVLFSGGLDCAVVAALVHKHAPASQAIDLLSVCFKQERDSPDRQTAIATWRELKTVYPERQWNLVCVNRSYQDVMAQERHIYSLILPNTSHMDFNIGAALWFAASGQGILFQEEQPLEDTTQQESREKRVQSCIQALLVQPVSDDKDVVGKEQAPQPKQQCAIASKKCSGIPKPRCSFGACGICCKLHQVESGSSCKAHKLATRGAKKRKRTEEETPERQGTALRTEPERQGEVPDSKGAYTSPARILFSGLGADELMGGYGRHRVEFKKNGWEALRKEMDLDVSRLWQRNLGRDDRCISDQGKEVRQPYLDENVMSLLRSIPIQHIVDPRLGPGLGDKKILRLVCCLLGLCDTARLEKRAIQFGTRIAQLSRGNAQGSNRSFKADTQYQLVKELNE